MLFLLQQMIPKPWQQLGEVTVKQQPSHEGKDLYQSTLSHESRIYIEVAQNKSGAKTARAAIRASRKIKPCLSSGKPSSEEKPDKMQRRFPAALHNFPSLRSTIRLKTNLLQIAGAQPQHSGRLRTHSESKNQDPSHSFHTIGHSLFCQEANERLYLSEVEEIRVHRAQMAQSRRQSERSYHMSAKEKRRFNRSLNEIQEGFLDTPAVESPHKQKMLETRRVLSKLCLDVDQKMDITPGQFATHIRHRNYRIYGKKYQPDSVSWCNNFLAPPLSARQNSAALRHHHDT